MAAVRHFELLFVYPGRPTKFPCWLEACVQISCRSDLYLRRYVRSNISRVWLKTPIRAPKIYVLGGFWPLNITFHHRDPQKALPWRKTRAMSHRASKSVQRCGQDAVRRIQKKKQRVEPKTVTNWVSAPPTPLFRSAPYFACWVAPWTCFLNLSFRTIGQEISELWGVEVRHCPLTRLIAYPTACCYRTSRDKEQKITLHRFFETCCR